VVDALGEQDTVRKKELFADAFRYCHRAHLDAIDSQIVYLLSVPTSVSADRLSEPGFVQFRRFHVLLSALTSAQLARRASGPGRELKPEEITPLLNEAAELYLALRPELTAAR
jgi:hypothetical protein